MTLGRQERRAVAIHEGGHVAAYFCETGRASACTVVPAGAYLGMAYFRLLGRDALAELRAARAAGAVLKRLEDELESECVALLAGRLAEERWNVECPLEAGFVPGGAEQDRAEFEQLVAESSPTGPFAVALRIRYRAEAEAVVRSPRWWRLTLGLADELLERRELSTDDVRAVFARIEHEADEPHRRMLAERAAIEAGRLR